MTPAQIDRAKMLCAAKLDWQDLYEELFDSADRERPRGLMMTAGPVLLGGAIDDGGFITVDIETGRKIADAALKIISAEMETLGITVPIPNG
jgi:hypothetical protein